MAAPDRKSWKRFERIIAAIELATSHGATVTWNESIEGRQFDVAVRFAKGPHQYLTLIECKEQKHPVAVEKVDAFATKSRDAKANKAVLVSASGFQAGCLEVAKRHGIELLRLNEKMKEPPGADSAPEQTTLGAYKFVIHFADARPPLPIPESNNRLDYLLAHGVVRQQAARETLKHLLDRVLSTVPLPDEYEKAEPMEISLPGTIMEIPTLLEPAPVRSLAFEVIKQRKRFVSMSGMDDHLARKVNLSFELFDCVQNRPVTTVDALALPIGLGTVFKPGTYYTSMLEQNYYCERLENGSVWLVLVEGYSHGNLFQAKLRAKDDVSKYYVEITDFPEILRLQKMYQRLQQAAPARNPHSG